MFKRENRYLVLRWDDIDRYINDDYAEILDRIVNVIAEERYAAGKNPFPTFVCVKSTWPEYEDVWQKIQERVEQKEREENASGS